MYFESYLNRKKKKSLESKVFILQIGLISSHDKTTDYCEISINFKLRKSFWL